MWYKPPKPFKKSTSRFWHYRWEVPAHLRAQNDGKRYVMESLKTTDSAEAQRLVHRKHEEVLAGFEANKLQKVEGALSAVDRAVDKYFAMGARVSGGMDEFCYTAMLMMFLIEVGTSANEAQAPEISQALGTEIDPLTMRVDQPIDLSVELTRHQIFEQQEITQGFALRETPRRLLNKRWWGPAAYFLEGIIPMTGWEWPPGSPGYNRAAEMFLLRLAEHKFAHWPDNLESALAATATGPALAAPKGPASLNDQAIEPAPQSGLDLKRGVSEASASGCLEVLSKAVDEWASMARPELQTVFEARRTVARFVELFGDIPVDRITRDMMIEFRKFLVGMPKNLQIKKITSTGMSFRDGVDAWKTSGKWDGKTMSPATIKKDFTALSAILNVYVQDNKLKENVAAEIRIPGYSKSKQSQAVRRLPLRETHLQALFASPLFLGCEGPGDIQRTRKGSQLFQDELYWTFLFGATAGPRLEEVGQVLLDDIEEFSFNGRDYAIIHITGTGSDQRTKTDESVRAVVVHQRLIELGFVDYVKRRRAVGAKRLFDLKQTPSTGKWTKELSRRVNRFIDRVATDDPHYVWYSMRHTFIDAALNAEVDLQIRRRMSGRAAKEVGEQYGLGPSVEKIAKNLEKIDLHFIDWAALNDARRRFLS